MTTEREQKARVVVEGFADLVLWTIFHLGQRRALLFTPRCSQRVICWPAHGYQTFEAWYSYFVQSLAGGAELGRRRQDVVDAPRAAGDYVYDYVAGLSAQARGHVYDTAASARAAEEILRRWGRRRGSIFVKVPKGLRPGEKATVNAHAPNGRVTDSHEFNLEEIECRACGEKPARYLQVGVTAAGDELTGGEVLGWCEDCREIGPLRHGETPADRLAYRERLRRGGPRRVGPNREDLRYFGRLEGVR